MRAVELKVIFTVIIENPNRKKTKNKSLSYSYSSAKTKLSYMDIKLNLFFITESSWHISYYFILLLLLNYYHQKHW